MTEIARTFFKNLLAGAPNGLTPADCGEWSEAAQVAQEIYQRNGIEGVKNLLPKLQQSAPALYEIICGDSQYEGHIGYYSEWPSWVPSVENTEVGRLVTDIIAWLKLVCDETPETMLRPAASWLVSALIYRRVALKLHFGPVFPNEFNLIVAPPGIVHKSTVAQAVRRLLNAVGAPTIPAIGTPESFERELSLIPHVNTSLTIENKQRWETERRFYRTRSLLIEEIGGLFSSWNKRDYLAGAREMILQAYDCAEIRSSPTKSHGVNIIEDIYMSLLGMTTLPAIVDSLKNDAVMWQDGTFSRFDVACELKLNRKPENYTSQNVDPAPPSELVVKLKRLFSGVLSVPELKVIDPVLDEKGKVIEPERYLVSTPKIKWAVIEPDSLEAWQRYHTHYHNKGVDAYNSDITSRSISNYSRVAIKALKKALLFATCDWAENGGELKVTLAHMERGIYWAEKARLRLEQLLEALHTKATHQQVEAKMDAVDTYAQKMLDFIKGSASGMVPKSGFTQKFRGIHRDKAFERIQSQIEEFQIRSEGSRKPVTYLKIESE